MKTDSVEVIRASRLVSIAGEKPARGKELLKPIKILDNAAIICRDGIILEVTSFNKLPVNCKKYDLGDVTLFPGLVNAHTHLQLSWLGGLLKTGLGFTVWIKSLVEQLLSISIDAFTDYSSIYVKEIELALKNLKDSGTRFIGDIGGSLPGSLSLIMNLNKKYGLTINHFCEWFGYSSDATFPWPSRCNKEIDPEICIPCGHALYSTNINLLKKIQVWCKDNKRIFTIHLAESQEENELVERGDGELFEFYRGKVLPDSWRPYELSPVALAEKYNLLANNTLAVHCVQLNDHEIELLAKNGTAICLCPRSNELIGVGKPDVKKMMEQGARLCLGTDGLSSNIDLDVRNEAIFLHETQDIPVYALWRMLTINGANALGLDYRQMAIVPKNQAIFTILPHVLEGD